MLSIINPLAYEKAMDKIKQMEDDFEIFTDQHEERIINAGLRYKQGRPALSNNHPLSHGNEVARFWDGTVCQDGHRFTCTCRDFCQGLERYFDPGKTTGAPSYNGQVYCWHIWSVELFGVPKPVVVKTKFNHRYYQSPIVISV